MEKLEVKSLLKIFESLDLQTLFSCRLVCKAWNDAIAVKPSSQGETTPDYVQPLLLNKPDWKSLMFSDSMKLSEDLEAIPSTILQNITKLHLKDCAMSRDCLQIVFGIKTLLDLRLNNCKLERSIFQEGMSMTPPDLKILCTNIQTLRMDLMDRDISFFSQILLPHLNSLVSLGVEELSRHSTTQTITLEDGMLFQDKSIDFLMEGMNWDSVVESTVQNFMNAIRKNSETLRSLKFDFLRSFDLWNNQLFTKIIPAMTENKLQLFTLALNSKNIPIGQDFISRDDGSDNSEISKTIATNLKGFLETQSDLKNLTLGMKQVRPEEQIRVLKSIPKTVEFLTINPIETNEDFLSNLQNLKRIDVPSDSLEITTPTASNEWPQQSSLFLKILKDVKDLPEITSFKGNMLFYGSDLEDFVSIMKNITELELRSPGIVDSSLQIIINGLKNLRSLTLRNVKLISDMGISGFDEERVKQIRGMNDYPKVLENFHEVPPGSPMSALIHLKELRISGRITATEFGILFGLKGLPLTCLELEFDSSLLPPKLTQWGINILAEQFEKFDILLLSSMENLGDPFNMKQVEPGSPRGNNQRYKFTQVNSE